MPGRITISPSIPLVHHLPRTETWRSGRLPAILHASVTEYDDLGETHIPGPSSSTAPSARHQLRRRSTWRGRRRQGSLQNFKGRGSAVVERKAKWRRLTKANFRGRLGWQATRRTQTNVVWLGMGHRVMLVTIKSEETWSVG